MNDQAEHFQRFLDKYVSCAVRNHYCLQWSKSNRLKTFLDKVTPSDIAYTILVYKNSKEVWEEELQIRVNSKTDDKRKKATRKQKPKYHEGRGKRLQRYGDGWTNNGQEYYQKLLGIFSNLVMYGRHYKIIGKCFRQNIITKVILVKMIT